jgi:peroxisomal 3,2-trans-enoyl-CoA isomerase
MWIISYTFSNADDDPSGADISQNRTAPPGVSKFRYTLENNVARNLSLVRAFHMHSKILVTALNGPVVGLSAALIAWSDFIYAHHDTYLLTPFASLGLVAEGGASYAFVRRMGAARATSALVTGRRLRAQELFDCGFVNKVFECDKDEFRATVLRETEEWMGPHLNGESMLMIKKLVNAGDEKQVYANVVDELFLGLDRQVAGIPQKEFQRLKRGEKKHKL